jgi:hypothetical protein
MNESGLKEKTQICVPLTSIHIIYILILFLLILFSLPKGFMSSLLIFISTFAHALLIILKCSDFIFYQFY